MTFAVFLHPESLFPADLSSNTLFGAICSAMADLGLPVDSMISSFQSGSAPFLLSSAFPFATDELGKRICFVPKPIFPSPRLSEDVFDQGKALKKVRWVESSIFSSLASGEINLSDLPALLKKGAYVVVGRALAPASSKFYGMPVLSNRMHNSIDRMTCESTAYYETEGVVYPKGSGLYCIITSSDPQMDMYLRAAFLFLSDRGIGKRISRGFGKFSVEFSDIIPISITQPKGELVMTLSRYIPQMDELSSFGGKLWYEMDEVCGISSDGMRRKRVRMFREGSMFRRIPEKKAYGTVETVRESPPVVEFGVMFPAVLGSGGFHDRM